MEKIDFNEAKRLFRIVSGKDQRESRYEAKLAEIKNLGIETKPETFLFWYTVFTFVQNKTYSTLTEKQVEDKLKTYPGTKIIYCKFPESQTPKPEILKGRKMQTETVTSHEQESELIYSTTGVKVPENDLRIPQKKAWGKDELPLGIRVRSFMKSVNEVEAKEKRVQEIYECLVEADAKKRRECLNNCKV